MWSERGQFSQIIEEKARDWGCPEEEVFIKSRGGAGGKKKLRKACTRKRKS